MKLGFDLSEACQWSATYVAKGKSGRVLGLPETRDNAPWASNEMANDQGARLDAILDTPPPPGLRNLFDPLLWRVTRKMDPNL